MKKKLNTLLLNGTTSAKRSLESTGRTHRVSLTSNDLLLTPSSTNIEPSKGRYEKRRKYRESVGRHWTPGGLAEQLSSQAVSPVSHSHKPDEDKERQMTATSGRQCMNVSLFSSQSGSSLKMLRDSLLGTTAWFSKQCVLTWKEKVTKSSRLLYQLAPSVRHTEGIESGLLPTSGAQDYKKRGPNSKQQGLGEKIFMLPTPATRDYKGAGKNGRDNVDSLIEQGATKGQIGIKTGLKLQPNFVEWMMGYQKDWTELPDSKLLEMRSSRRSQKKSLEQLKK